MRRTRHRLGVAAVAAATVIATAAPPFLTPALAAGEAADGTFERIPEPALDACAEASTYQDNDDSERAERARRRCRLDEFTEQRDEERRRKGAALERRRQELEKRDRERDQPPRAGKTFAADGFVSGGIVTYGLAAAWLPRANLEVEAWFGARDQSSYNFAATLFQHRRAGGLRGKWLLTSTMIAPFVTAGFAFTRADLTATIFNTMPTDFQGGVNTSGTGSGHLLTLGAGLAMTAGWGLRISLEYLFAYPIYAQGFDQTGTPDDTLKHVFNDSLNNDRSSIRLQVGYAF